MKLDRLKSLHPNDNGTLITLKNQVLQNMWEQYHLRKSPGTVVVSSVIINDIQFFFCQKLRSGLFILHNSAPIATLWVIVWYNKCFYTGLCFTIWKFICLFFSSFSTKFSWEPPSHLLSLHISVFYLIHIYSHHTF